MKERIFKGYFSDGGNIDDIATLTAFAKQIGLNATEVKNTLESTRFTDEVNHDLAEARRTGITSVPQYVFNKKSKVPGAQDSKVYLEMLEKEFALWQADNLADAPEVIDGKSCRIGGQCE
jgi:protein disulfide-isomerase